MLDHILIDPTYNDRLSAHARHPFLRRLLNIGLVSLTTFGVVAAASLAIRVVLF